eukprot:scaffold284541_cov13-Tisochrysis_lutea.AAC.1
MYMQLLVSSRRGPWPNSIDLSTIDLSQGKDHRGLALCIPYGVIACGSLSLSTAPAFQALSSASMEVPGGLGQCSCSST